MLESNPRAPQTPGAPVTGLLFLKPPENPFFLVLSRPGPPNLVFGCSPQVPENPTLTPNPPTQKNPSW